MAITSTDRFRFALNNLQVGDWERFEKLASAFMAADFLNLRTTANTSGDGGRDAELYETDKPTVVVQFSIAQDWKAKIGRTAKRLVETGSQAKMLIYVTNQLIGANGDAKKTDLFTKNSLFLDIRDQSWFLERLRGCLDLELTKKKASQ